MEPVFFKTPEDFRAWLANNHTTQTELLVGFYKKGTGRPSITWPQSVDQALCYGWIDGVRRSRDAESYTVRFTPRKPNSIWSAVNIAKMESLTAQGLVTPAGQVAYARRQEHNSKIYAYEQQEQTVLSAAFETAFKQDTAAWDYFTAQAPYYKKTIIHWVMTAKQQSTRNSRFEKLLQACREGKRIGW